MRWIRFAILPAVLGVLAGVRALTAAGDPLADLKAGATALEAKRYPAAIAALDGLPKRLPKLADYAAFFLASAEFESKDYKGAEQALGLILQGTAKSPLGARAAMLLAQVFDEEGQEQSAVAILRKAYADLPQPAGDLALGDALTNAGDQAGAVTAYQRLYCNYPLSTEATKAEAALAALRSEMGAQYQEAPASDLLARAFKILDGRQPERARAAMENLLPRLTGAERDQARMGIGVALYNANQTTQARAYLKALEVTSPEVDAERLHYLMQCARRLTDPAGISAALESLARSHPSSPWRMQALLAAANHYLLDNQSDAYEPLYRACYESFAKDPQAGLCHWKTAWIHYLRRTPDAADLLREQVRMFPGSEDTPAAIYYLGRIAEAASDAGSARAYYEEVAREYPNFYYATVARERLSALGAGAPSPSAAGFLRGVAFPTRSHVQNFQPNATARARIERARLLHQAGLDTWAEGELRFGAQTEDQPHLMAMELASLDIAASKPELAVRAMKRYAGTAMFLPVESAPLDFWRLIFPLPYRTDLERFSKDYGVDPFLMAGLIRQESEFDAHVTSYANARGLTQIEPSTGRELSQRLKVTPYSTERLFQPSLNLRLGTYYMKLLNTQAGGKVEVALAAYNAGISRARAWLTWGEFREPSEFIETVPFTQTREYIQAVLRNADTYRRVYGDARTAAKGQ